MTEAEFLELEPREQDAVVATRIFGHDVTNGREIHDDGSVPDGLIFTDTSFMAKWWDDGICGTPVPAYTTDWKAMKLVVEKMHEKGWEVEMKHNHRAKQSKRWFAAFHHPEQKILYTALTEDPPLAVSIAALKAEGVIEG